jgi:CDH1/2 SANT-Helical linker 1
LEDLAADAELQEKSEADLLYLVDLILTNCHQTMKEYDEKMKEPILATATASNNDSNGVQISCVFLKLW